jgi:hypothetical protein
MAVNAWRSYRAIAGRNHFATLKLFTALAALRQAFFELGL